MYEVKWENEDIQDFVKKVTAHGALAGDEKCYVVFIGNKRFITPNGKGVWRKKNHASAAVTYYCKDIAASIISNKLQAIMPPEEYYRGRPYIEASYKYALKNVIGILKTNNMFEIREVDPNKF